MRKYDLQERSIALVLDVIALTSRSNNEFAYQHLSKQLVRSSTSIALNYSEAQSAESRKDFVHKMKLALKELNESKTCLVLIQRAKLNPNAKLMDSILNEMNQLTAIFAKSIQTAKSNLHNKNT